MLPEITCHIIRIFSLNLDVGAEPVKDVVVLLGGQHIGGVAGERIGSQKYIHIAHQKMRIMLVGIPYDPGGGHQLVVERLKTGLRIDGYLTDRSVKSTGCAQREYGSKRSHAAIYLIKGQPVFYQMLVALEDRAAAALKQRNQFRRRPAVVFFHQGVGHFVVAQGHEGFDAVFSAFLEHILIKGQTGLVRRLLHTCRENPRPVDRGAEYFKTHLSKQGNIFAVVMIKIDCLMAGIKPVGMKIGGDAFGLCLCPVRTAVGDGDVFSVGIPGAFELICGAGAGLFFDLIDGVCLFPRLLFVILIIQTVQEGKKTVQNEMKGIVNRKSIYLILVGLFLVNLYAEDLLAHSGGSAVRPGSDGHTVALPFFSEAGGFL